MSFGICHCVSLLKPLHRRVFTYFRYLTIKSWYVCYPAFAIFKKITNNNIMNYPLQKSTWMLKHITNKVSMHFLQANKSNHNCGLWHKTIKHKIFYAQYIYDTMRGKCRKRHLYLYILLVIKINEGKVKDIMFPFPNLFSLNTTTLNTRYLIISLYLQSMVIAWPIHLSTRQRFWNHHYFGQ